MAERLSDLVGSNWTSAAIYAAVRLGLPDQLRNGARTSVDLAGAIGAAEGPVKRLLAALTTLEVCIENNEGAFALTEMGALLRKDVPASLHDWTMYWHQHLAPLWNQLADSIATGEAARGRNSERDGFGHLESDPTLAVLFDTAMTEFTQLVAKQVVSSYDFSGRHSIVDIGGGAGALLGEILNANPSTQGLLYDLPRAITRGRLHLRRVGVDGRCRFVSGDFFKSLPRSCDIYLLKNVLHNWKDHECLTILHNCRKVMRSDSRLIVVERIVPVPTGVSASDQAVMRSDLGMLLAHGAKERTLKEYVALLESSALRMVSATSIGLSFSLIEISPA